MQEKIKITSYKPSGKWYNSVEVDVPDSLKNWNKSFSKFVWDNCDQIGSGYVVVSNANPDSVKFFEFLYEYHELKFL